MAGFFLANKYVPNRKGIAMKSQDLLLELRSIVSSLQNSREYIVSGMGTKCPFLRDESERLTRILEDLQRDYDNQVVTFAVPDLNQNKDKR